MHREQVWGLFYGPVERRFLRPEFERRRRLVLTRIPADLNRGIGTGETGRGLTVAVSF